MPYNYNMLWLNTKCSNYKMAEAEIKTEMTKLLMNHNDEYLKQRNSFSNI